MKEKRYGTLKGLEAPILTYESIEEADAAGGPGAALNECNNNLAYRGPLQTAREVVVQMLQEKTGIEPRKRDSGRKDKTGNAIMVDEAEGSYVDWVCSQKGWEDLTAFQSEFDSRCRAVVETDADGEPKKDEHGQPITFALSCDITQRVRTSKPKVLAAKYIETARKVLAGTKVDKFLADIKTELGKEIVLTGDTEADVKTLGWAAKALCEVREKAQLASMAG